MPTVHRQNGYRLFFYSHEPNEPPHVHIDRGDGTAKIWLHDLSFACMSGFRPKELTAILAIVRGHREALLEAWHGYFGTEGG